MSSSRPAESLQSTARRLHSLSGGHTSEHAILRELRVQVDPLIPAFTRRREVFASRFAMAGLGIACVLEAVLPDHPGLLVQASQLTGGLVEPATVYFLYLGIVAYNTERGSSLWGPTFEEANLQDVAKRPKGPPGAAIDPFNHPMQFLGINGWGFTKRNEIFHGRIAMLSYFAALVRGIRIGGLYGPGPVAQVSMRTVVCVYVSVCVEKSLNVRQEFCFVLVRCLENIYTQALVYVWVSVVVR
uniref:Uncharacterized protein n=1 Tax=Dunaliella tertiolecta TaxID=3047 RepID=A0A7S3VK19_DUNTE